jgi:hypothetical protein
MLAEVKRGLTQTILLLAGVVSGLVLGGCSFSDDDDEPKKISGAPKEVARVVARLETATRRRQFNILCDQLFTEAARGRAGGKDCVALLRETAKDVRKARIRLLDVKIDGHRAKARVRTTAQGQTAVEETIDLVRKKDGYRIAALES